MDLLKHIQDNRYIGYSYSYPHKHAYRELAEPVKISQVWEKENKQSLFLYIHIPFCEMRCNFCNLFTLSHPGDDLIDRYIDKLQLQAETVEKELGSYKISRVAIGGGTPTILNITQLIRVFDMLKNIFHIDFKQIPCSIESSPATISDEKIAFFKEVGVTRISIGIQSFLENETFKMGRPDNLQSVTKALSTIRDAYFAQFNIDLIYGYENQTARSMQYSIESMDVYNNNEVFLYPLYVRPLTGCSKKRKQWEDNRIKLYELGRNLLYQRGFSQMSMRFFRKEVGLNNAIPEYCCQQDGMIGLGAGARSYTQNLHYSFEYAVSRKSTKNIIETYCRMDRNEFAMVHYGTYLNMDEQKRRYLIKSLLHIDGMNAMQYLQLFKTDVLSDFPLLVELEQLGLCNISSVIRLTTLGMDYSDAIGPLFYSDTMKEKIQLFALA